MQPVGIGYPTNRDNQLIYFKHLGSAAGIGVLNTYPFTHFYIADLHAQLNRQTLFRE